MPKPEANVVKFPVTVKVGAHTYRVLFPYCFKENTSLCGQADHSLLEIRVAGVDQGGNPRAETKILGVFIHELIHCVDSSWGIGLKEEQVEQLEEGLLTVLVDNGWLKLEQ